MNNRKKLSAKIKWISLISRRFSNVDRKGRSAVTSTLAMLGICFGVMTLISVMSVMNGFQMSFIDSIIEVSSYHIRIENYTSSERQNLLSICEKQKYISSETFFLEAQALISGNKDSESAAIIRAVSPDVLNKDKGLQSQLRIINGSFDLGEKGNIVLGSGLAKNLGVKKGDTVNLLVMSGGSDVDLFSQNRIFTVKGIFSCGYGEINNTFCFINYEDGLQYFGKNCPEIIGIKLKENGALSKEMHFIKKNYPSVKVSSWREYNKSFFGALRIEKNMLLLLVALIFVVVAINIYNGMRRLVFERKNEIAILSALGGTASEIKLIFILRGLFTGAVGSFFGVVSGLFISINSKSVFLLCSKIMYFFTWLFTLITKPENIAFIGENSSFLLYASIPARIYLNEVILIALFGIAAPLLASFAASKNVLKMTVAEVLHDE